MYLLDQLAFCQWDILFVGGSFYSLECFTTMPFVTYNNYSLAVYTRLKEGQHVQSFVIPCSLYANQQNYSGGVAKEQIKHRQKNSNKTEMLEKIRALGNGAEMRQFY